jgi:biopolymer transport protein ExbD
MRKSNSRPETTGHHEVNMTPLIDVSLVLVVILLLATPLAFESAVAIKRTETSGKKAEDPKQVEVVEIDIVSDDVVFVNRTEVARADLVTALSPLLGRSLPQQVVVTCADDVSHGAFVNVLDLTKLSGATTIAIMGE